MKTRFALITDVIFTLLITFTLFLIFFNFFIPYPSSILFSLCLAMICCMIYYRQTNKKSRQNALKSSQKQEMEKLITELNFSDRKEQNDILEKALKSQNLTTERKRGGIVIKDKNAVVFSRFSFQKVGKTDVVKAFNNINKNENAYLLAESFDTELVAFADRFDNRIKLVDGKKVYEYLKKTECMPKFKYDSFTERKKKANLKKLLDKKKAKTFLLFGIGFILSSYISPLKLYYIICGAIFLIYALILRLFGKEINSSPQNA